MTTSIDLELATLADIAAELSRRGYRYILLAAAGEELQAVGNVPRELAGQVLEAAAEAINPSGEEWRG